MIKIGEGEFSEAFRIEPGKVIKLFKIGEYDEKAFALEYKAAKHMGDVTSLAPKVYGTMTINNRMGYVMAEAEGVLYQKVIDNNPSKLNEYGLLLGKTHKKLHKEKISPELDQLPKFKDFIKAFLSENDTLDREVNLWLVELLDGLSGDQCLLHGDFMPYNMIYRDGTLQVLDWAEPSVGPAAADVARTMNFIYDSSDYTDSAITKSSLEFIGSYIEGYYGGSDYDKNQLHKAFLINSAAELSWAYKSNQYDGYAKELKTFILKNFTGGNNYYMPFM